MMKGMKEEVMRETGGTQGEEKLWWESCLTLAHLKTFSQSQSPTIQQTTQDSNYAVNRQ